MNYAFNTIDALQFAVKIEENGEKFYREAAKLVQEGSLKEMLVFLADEEVRHKETFQSMLTRVDTINFEESNEYLDYLASYAGTKIFSDKATDPETIRNMGGSEEIVDYAISREINSIAYYSELKNIVRSDKQSIIEEIVNEERSHFSKLMKIKEGLKIGL